MMGKGRAHTIRLLFLLFFLCGCHYVLRDGVFKIFESDNNRFYSSFPHPLKCRNEGRMWACIYVEALAG